MAERVARLSRLHDHAHDRRARKTDAVDEARGPRPVRPAGLDGATDMEDHAVDPASDVERRFTMTFRKPPADREAARQTHADALASWQAQGERLARLNGENHAAMLCDALFDSLQDATDALAAMPATSPVGMAVKARVFLALMETRDGAEQWEVDLGRSLARDVARIGAA